LDNFLNQLKAQASQLDQGWAQPRLAIVSSINPATYSARVSVQPEGVLSGWLPIASAWVGAGWGLACLPAPGDQVLVIWQEGDSEQGIIVARLWSSSVPPPEIPVGELWLQHKTGSFLKLHNDGSIESSASVWTHSGDFRVSGDVFDSHGSLAQLRGHYNEHVHPPSNAGPEPTD
jgi:hypothetical protein